MTKLPNTNKQTQFMYTSFTLPKTRRLAEFTADSSLLTQYALFTHHDKFLPGCDLLSWPGIVPCLLY